MTKTSRTRQLILIATLLATTAACRYPDAPTTVELERGLVWVFPGVAGRYTSLDAVRAFRDAGVESAIEMHDWDRLFATLRNLTRYEENRKDAAKIATRITQFAELHPDQPIDLVGYSGGGGMAVFVAEALPDDVRVRRIILVQPALSPDYDLTPALQHVTDRLVHFHSPRDWFILGWGTSLFGTMDRKHVASAGRNGFDENKAVPDPALRARLDQRPWKREMMDAGHWGNHVAITNYNWNRTYVAPLLAHSENMNQGDEHQQDGASE